MANSRSKDQDANILCGYARARLPSHPPGQPQDGLIEETNDAFEQTFNPLLDRCGSLKGLRLSLLAACLQPSGNKLIEELGRSGFAVVEEEGRPRGGPCVQLSAYMTGPDCCALFACTFPKGSPELPFLTPRRQCGESELFGADFIFNSTQDAMFVAEYKAGEFRYLCLNAAHSKISGFRNEEIVGKTPLDIWGEETGRRLHAFYMQGLQSSGGITLEEELEIKGKALCFLTSLTPVHKEGVQYLIVSRKNITQNKALQKENLLLFRRLQSMFNDHTAVMLIIDPESGRILDVNPAACEFYGYEKAELLALSIQDINTLSAEETARLRKRALQRGQGHFIMPHRRKNGEVRIVEVLSCPFDNQDGRKLFSITFDVTDRETYRENLFREKELLNTTLRSIGDGVVTIDTKGRITSINKAAEEIILFGTDEVVGRPFREVFRLIREKDGQPAADPAQTVLETGKARSVASNTAVLNKRGERISISDSASPIINEKGELLGVVVVFRDVRAEKAREKEVTFLSSHDPLTGLYNRRHMECALRCLDESACVPVSIVMGDVNGLKIANDVFSHETGDRLLERVSAVLRECAGSGDVIARWGGDEFLMALPNVPVEDAEAMIRRLKARLREQSKGITPLSVSFGCAEKTTPDQRIGEVIRKAEERMYHQKLLESKTYRNAIVSSLMASLYEKSLESKEHAERLGKYCRAIGEELALSDRELNELALLSVLHDIGKVGIKQEILQKTGELTQEEKTEVKKHSEIGYRIALNTPELIDVSELILSHHEHWDGTGYPSGLAGTQIPLSCRILSVVDAYDAMTNDRVYRKAMPKREAIRELREHAGSQFDPAIVEVFLPIVTNEQPDAQTDPGQNLLC